MQSKMGLMRVPEEFLRPSLPGTAFFVGAALLMYLAPVLAIQSMLEADFTNAGGLNLSLILLPWLIVLAGQGLHAFGIIGHDGMHFNLHRHRVVSAIIGIFFSSLVPLHMDVGFALWHSRHHRWTNTALDPDLAIFIKYKNFFSRMLCARPAASRQHFAETLKVAFGEQAKVGKIELPISFKTLKRLARFNLICSGWWLSVYLLITYRWPLIALCSIWLPYLVTICLSGIRPYVEHASTGTGKFENARSWTAPIFDLLFLGHNYHLAHHLVSRVPTYRLRSFNQWLKANGYYEGHAVHEESTFGGYWSHARSGSIYPTSK